MAIGPDVHPPRSVVEIVEARGVDGQVGRFVLPMRPLEFDMLRERPVRRVVLAQLTSALGDGMVIAVLPFAVRATGGSSAEFAIALAVQAFTMAIWFLPAGVAGDRLDRRLVLIGSDLLRFVARAAFAMLLILGDGSFWQLVLAQVAHGVGTALFQATMDGFLPEVVPGSERRLRRVNALRTIAVALGWAVGPAMGGLVYAFIGPGWAFALDAMTFLGSAALIRGLKAPRGESKPANVTGVVEETREGLLVFGQIPWFWRVALGTAVLNTLAFAPFFVLGPEAAGTVGNWSTILLSLGLGELLGAVVAMNWEPSQPLFSATAIILLWGPFLLLLGIAPLPVVLLGGLLAGVSNSIFDAIWETTKQTHTPENLRARLSSIDLLGSLGFLPLGFLLGGAALNTIGLRPSLEAGAAVVLATTLLVATSHSVRSVSPLFDSGESAGARARARSSSRARAKRTGSRVSRTAAGRARWWD